jgi:D-alanyl-D-alanine carboxypeptidase
MRSILLAVALLMLFMITTSQQLSDKDTQGQAISQHNIGENPSRQIVIVPHAGDHPAPPVLATAAYLLDADTGATLYASHPFIRLPMLSTTKLMTALVAMQIGNPNQNIVINDTIVNDINQLTADSSMMGIKKGETYTLKDLLYGLLLASGNDAAVAIADQLGGGNQQHFVDKMNQEAVKLGLLDTHYVNPHGLLEAGQFSSARDLALLEKYSLRVPLIHTISSTRKYDIPKNALHDEHQILNTNQFLWWYPGVDGGKPGWDTETNFVQVISCVRNHRHLIGVVMHANDWWTDMRDLMNWGFNTFDWISPRDLSANELIPYAADWGYFARDTQQTTIPTPDHGRYYVYTGYSISNPIMAYFDTNGGLHAFGFPISQAKTLSNDLLTQRFEHSTIQCNQGSKHCMKM